MQCIAHNIFFSVCIHVQYLYLLFLIYVTVEFKGGYAHFNMYIFHF